jgi:hypothetical protein
MKRCPRCLEEFTPKTIVGTVDGVELCAVCAAAKIGKDSGIDVDLAQGLAATFLGQSRGQAFLSSYVQRRLAQDEGAPPSPPMDPLVAQALGFVSDLAVSARKKPTEAQRRGVAALKKAVKKKRGKKS